MTQVEAIKAMLKASNHKAVWVSEKMGYASKSTLGQMMQRKNVSVDTLIEIADLLGYNVVLTPQEKRDAVRVPIKLNKDETKERNTTRSGIEQ